MNLNALSLPELEAQQEQLLNKLCRIRTAIQRKKGTENIEQQIARLPEKQRAFVVALWRSPTRSLELIDIERKVWGKEHVASETVRNLVWRVENTIEKNHIPLFIDTVKRKNGDVRGYTIRKK